MSHKEITQKALRAFTLFAGVVFLLWSTLVFGALEYKWFPEGSRMFQLVMLPLNSNHLPNLVLLAITAGCIGFYPYVRDGLLALVAKPETIQGYGKLRLIMGIFYLVAEMMEIYMMSRILPLSHMISNPQFDWKLYVGVYLLKAFSCVLGIMIGYGIVRLRTWTQTSVLMGWTAFFALYLSSSAYAIVQWGLSGNFTTSLLTLIAKLIGLGCMCFADMFVVKHAFRNVAANNEAGTL